METNTLLRSTKVGVLTLLFMIVAGGVRAIEPQFRDAKMKVQPKVVLKATYQRVIDKSAAGALSDSFLGGVGFFF